MRRPAASGLGFAVARGTPIDLGRVLSLDAPRSHQPGRRRLLAVVEPLEPTDRGHDVAMAALAALRDGFWSAARRPLAVALGEAFAAANAAVRDENRLCAGEGRDRRAGVGATAIALEGRRLVLAQVPPSQAVLVQEGRIYAFPDLASWHEDYDGIDAGVRIAPDPDPLGCRERANPDLFRTLAAPDDLIVLCASAIPCCVARDGELRGAGFASLVDLLRHGDPDAVAARLGGVVEAHRLDDAHAACCTVGRLHSLDAALARETIARLALSWGAARPAARWADGAAGLPRQRGRTASRGPAGVPGAGRRRRSFARLGVALDEPDPDRGDDPNPDRGDDPNPDRDAEREPDPPPRPERSPAGRPLLVPLGGGSPVQPRPLGGETGSVRGNRPLAAALGPIGILDAPLDRAGDPAASPAVVAAGPTRTVGPVPRSFGDGMYVGAHPRRARALDGLHLRLTRLGERLAPRRLERPQRAGRLIAAVSPGVLGLERHRGGGPINLPGGWQLELPVRRAAGRWRVATAACLALLLIAGGAGAFGSGPLAGAADRAGVSALAARLDLPGWTGLDARQRRAVVAALAEVDDRLAAAGSATDPAVASQELALAEAALADAAGEGAAADALAARQAGLDAARDRAAGIVRLAGPIRVGVLPAGAAGPATLLLDGSTVLVAGQTLDRLNESTGELARLAGAGDRLGEVAIGALRGAALDDGGLLLTDGVTLFQRAAAGTWSSRPLPPPAGDVAAWPVAPCGAFAGNFYWLDAAGGRILKFAGDDPAGVPRDWAAGANAEELRTARDLVVDGRIHVLLADGRVLTFFGGELERTYALPPDFLVGAPVALHAGADGRSLYVLDGGEDEGRLYRIDRETGAVHELALGANGGASTGLLAGARDVAVDEERGFVFLLTDDALWRAALPRSERRAH